MRAPRSGALGVRVGLVAQPRPRNEEATPSSRAPLQENLAHQPFNLQHPGHAANHLDDPLQLF